MKELEAFKHHYSKYRDNPKFDTHSDWGCMWTYLVRLLERLVKIADDPTTAPKEKTEEWLTIPEFMAATGLDKINLNRQKVTNWCHVNASLCPNGIRQAEKSAHYQVKTIPLMKALSIYPFKSACEREVVRAFTTKYLEENSNER